jgi:5-methyltetrahydropteroyltriglutamate--homocysteine methyltransferase
VRRTRAILVDDVRFLRANSERRIKATLPGPFTMSQQAQDDFYGDEEALAMDLAAAVNAEVRDLFAAGADVVQLDEPYLQARPEKARRFALRAINRAVDGVRGTTALHTCFGYAHIVHDRPRGYPFLEELAGCSVDQISLEAAQQNVDLAALRSIPKKTFIVGVLDLGDSSPVETVEIVVRRIEAALRHVPADRLLAAPDCGMKYLARTTAFAKLQAMVAAADRVRAMVH